MENKGYDLIKAVNSEKEVYVDDAKRFLASRCYNLISEIDEASIIDVIDILDFINAYDTELELNGGARKPFTIVLNTVGGELAPTMTLIDKIRLSNTPIHIYASGEVASAGFLIYLASDNRTCSPFTRLMCHKMAYGASGALDDQEARLIENKIVQTQIEEYICSRCNIDIEELRKRTYNSRDWWMSAEQAKELGIVHEII